MVAEEAQQALVEDTKKKQYTETDDFILEPVRAVMERSSMTREGRIGEPIYIFVVENVALLSLSAHVEVEAIVPRHEAHEWDQHGWRRNGCNPIHPSGIVAAAKCRDDEEHDLRHLVDAAQQSAG